MAVRTFVIIILVVSVNFSIIFLLLSQIAFLHAKAIRKPIAVIIASFSCLLSSFLKDFRPLLNNLIINVRKLNLKI